MAIVSIELDEITAIENLGRQGSLVRKVNDPHEHLSASFYDVLEAYCKAVDESQGAMTIDD